MNKEQLEIHLKSVDEIYKEIESLSEKNYSNKEKSNGDLSEYLENFSQKLRWFDHGEKDMFYMPHWYALNSIESLEEDFSEKQFKTAFLTVHKRLLSIVKKYLKEMTYGLQQLDQE